MQRPSAQIVVGGSETTISWRRSSTRSCGSASQKDWWEGKSTIIWTPLTSQTYMWNRPTSASYLPCIRNAERNRRTHGKAAQVHRSGRRISRRMECFKREESYAYSWASWKGSFYIDMHVVDRCLKLTRYRRYASFLSVHARTVLMSM